MHHSNQIYINGTWVPSASSTAIPVVNPATEEVIAAVPAGTAVDADRAVAVARKAFSSWSAVTPAERAKYVTAFRDALAARTEELADLICADLGAPRAMALPFHVKNALAKIAMYTDTARNYAWEEPSDVATIVRPPVGVVVAITPWNAPLTTSVDKITPALLAGCPVVFKPSEVAPLAAWAMAEVIDEAGFPPGVFNLVSGAGATVGEALVSHPEVDMITFTGSTRVGKRIGAMAAERAARFMLEMGGKSANIILEDADLDQALKPSVMSCFANSGQICTALTRLLVHHNRYAAAVERIKAIAEQVTVGDPATDVDLGPVVSRAQRDRVRGYIEQGIAEGAVLVAGGAEPPEGLEKGFFVRPTVFADVTSSMTIAQEEIFGPVLSVIEYEDEDHAVSIANDIRYGLSGSVWSADPEHARRVARRLRTGGVGINGQRPGPTAPFGGFKQSGTGRTNGRFALDEYVEMQAIATEQAA
ncbi:MAG TPA: aldehyde dehydrogenase family protein [Streptosporangiaceae bacterium]